MASSNTTVYVDPNATPLTASVLPNGQVVISHAPVDTSGVPVYNAGHIERGVFEGEIFGIPTKYVILGIAAYFLFGKK